MYRKNPILATDFYKTGHWLQYPVGAEYVSSYVCARKGGNILADDDDIPAYGGVVFLGLGAWLVTFLSEFQITQEDIDHAEAVITGRGLPFNRLDWEYILATYGGRLPVRIVALQEGTVVPFGVPMLQLMNTDPRLPWLTSYLETSLLRAIWYPSTVGTLSREIKRLMIKYLCRTDSNQVGLPYMLNDFGARGVSGTDSAALGGFAHLTQFEGTDNLEAIELAGAVYHGFDVGASVIAAEHSTITSWGKENELDVYRHMLRLCPDNGIVSVVSDSYNYWATVGKVWGQELMPDVLALGERGGRLVVRPDSGNPVTTPVDTVGMLASDYSEWCTTTRTGHKVLPPFLRVIQGDGVDYHSIEAILDLAERSGFAAENFVFGMGGALLQKVNRDTFGFAMKASAICVDGKWRDVAKETPGKQSKAGLFYVEDDMSVMKTLDYDRSAYHLPGKMEVVYSLRGEGHRTRVCYTLERIRDNAKL